VASPAASPAITWTGILHGLQAFADFHLFMLGGAEITPATLIVAAVSLLGLLYFSGWFRQTILARLLARGHFDLNTRETIGTLSYYTILAVGVILILDATGIKLSSFAVLAGAMGVGVGFGLQNIVSNFISGLIVMFERPAKLGDHVVVGGFEGDVVSIGMRATTLRTAQGSLVYVPNQSFITGNVVNWAQFGHSAVVLQFRMLGKLAEDEALLLQIASDIPEVLDEPPPAVFISFADQAGHVLELHFRLAGDEQQRLKVISDVYRTVLDRLEKLGQALGPNP
jgi:small-conductance mechanosensitive channel